VLMVVTVIWVMMIVVFRSGSSVVVVYSSGNRIQDRYLPSYLVNPGRRPEKKKRPLDIQVQKHKFESNTVLNRPTLRSHVTQENQGIFFYSS
jgi:hypothetical protein